MSQPVFHTITEQVADHLRGELLDGRWQGTIPGLRTLAPMLGVNSKTVEAALDLLEKDGLLVGQGAGRPRRIALPPDAEIKAPTLRFAILEHAPPDRAENSMNQLVHRLEAAGHNAFFTKKTLTELRMEMSRVRALVDTVSADGWIVCAASRAVLEWFSSQATPVFAFFGRMDKLPIAGAKPDKSSALRDATSQLAGLGHRRIVLLARKSRRLPEPGRAERAFLHALQSHGAQTSPYNLPDWDESVHGFCQILDSLFTATPPTALIVDEAPMFIAVQQFLGNRGLKVPGDVSLICTDGDAHFDWCTPSIAHIRWDYHPVIRRVVRWSNHVARGKKDLKQTLTKAEFVPGGTIGKAPVTP